MSVRFTTVPFKPWLIMVDRDVSIYRLSISSLINQRVPLGVCVDTNLKHKRFFLKFKVLKCNFKWPSSKDGIVKFPTFYHILSNVTITLSIYILCLSVYPFFVRLYPINVKTAETTGPKFCGGLIPGKVYWRKKSWKIVEVFMKMRQNYKCNS